MVAGRIFCAGVFLFLPLFALFPEPISLPEKSGISVGRILEILEDREGKFTIAQAMAEKGWKAGSADILNFGPTSSVYWARFRLKNNTTEESWLVAQRVPLMEDIVFYEILPEIVSSRVGMMFPFGQRKINHRYFLFPVRILPGEEREFVLRFSNSDIMTFDIAVFSAMDFYREAAFEYLIFGLYFGTMLIMVLYNFFIFLSARDPSYRSYIFFTAVAALHAFSQNGFSYQFFWPDHPWFASRINVMLVGIYAATGLSFTRSFLSVSTLRPRFDLYIRAFIIVALFYSAASAFVEFQLAVRLATFISLATLLTMLSAGILSILSGFRSARFFLAGFVAFIAGGTAYSLKTLGILPSNVLTHYGIQAGSIVEVVLFSLALADRINFLRLDLASKIEDLDRAKNRIELSERKYRSLVENTGDFVFSLSLDFEFQSVNRGVTGLLGYRPDKLQGLHFHDLLTYDEGSFLRGEIVSRALHECVEKKKATTFRAKLRAAHGEGRELDFRIEYIDDPDESILLGRALPVDEDTLVRFVQSEKMTAVLDNYLTSSDLMADRMTRSLNRYLDKEQTIEVRVALREMLINALEHGNLGISFQEKTGAMETGKYLDFLLLRQKDPKYAGRRIKAEYSLNSSRVIYRITDDGEGFDHASMTDSAALKANEEKLEHGRGIGMTQLSFDLVRYNQKGNQVLLVKYFKPNQR